jgi:hypothetical protein
MGIVHPRQIMNQHPQGSPIAEGDEAYEAQHVHDVYNEIASHFSSTRYKVCTSLLRYLDFGYIF